MIWTQKIVGTHKLKSWDFISTSTFELIILVCSDVQFEMKPQLLSFVLEISILSDFENFNIRHQKSQNQIKLRRMNISTPPNILISDVDTPPHFQHFNIPDLTKIGVQMFTPRLNFNISTSQKWVFSVLRISFLPRKKRDFNTKIPLSDFLNGSYTTRASKSGFGNGPIIRLKVGPFNRELIQIQRGLTGVSKRGSFGALNMSTWAYFGCWDGEKKLSLQHFNIFGTEMSRNWKLKKS